jgi:hypothetical protein
VHQAADAVGARRQVVCVAEAAQHLADGVDDDREWQAARLDDAVEVLALDQLHDEVEAALVVAIEVEDRHDVGVLHARRQLRLADEHVREGRVARRIGQHALDRDRALEAFGADGVTAEHLGHAAHPEWRVEDVLAEADGRGSLRGSARISDLRRHQRSRYARW